MKPRDRIVRHVESAGWKVNWIEWEPIGLGGEMEGPSGGWQAEITDGERTDMAMGYNWQQAIAWADNIIAGEWLTDPLSCAGTMVPNNDQCVYGRGHKGDCLLRGDTGSRLPAHIEESPNE